MATELERLKEGARLAQEGRYEEALSTLERLLLDTPEEPDVLFMIGACYFKKGDSRAARANWEKVLQFDPGHAKAQGMLDKLTASESPDAPKPLTAAQQAIADKAAKKKPLQKPTKPWKKWALLGALPVLLILLAADMMTHPQSYPFLGGGKKESQNPTDGSGQTYEDPSKRRIPLETGLAGRWYFKWEGDPTTLTFHPNGNMNVIRNMQGGLKLAMQGSYKVEGDQLLFNLTFKDPTQGVEITEEVTMYNAKIEGVNLTFNFLDPDGPVTLAVKQ
jgi:hypothetical protein